MPRTLLAVTVASLCGCGGAGLGDRGAAGASGGAVEEPVPPVAEARGAGAPPAYPPARRDDVLDDYHGTEVADPYRWLEKVDSPETRAWIEAENEVTFRYLAGIPQRGAIEKRLTALWDYERYDTPWRRGDRYFWRRNDGLQNQSVVYWAESFDAPPRVLIDPNAMSTDGTVALSGLSVSEDGRLLAYGVTSAGSDWEELRVRHVDTGEDLPDVVRWVKFSQAEWTHDARGFFYARYPEPKAGAALTDANLHHQIYYHRLGTPQEKDVLVFERPDQPKWGFTHRVTDDGRYLVIEVWKGTGDERMVLYLDLGKWRPGASPDPVTLIGTFDHHFAFVSNDGPVFWFVTDKDAPRRCVVAIDTRRPQEEHWVELVPETADALQGVSAVGGRLFLEYVHDAHSRIVLHDEKGAPLGELALPGLGSVQGLHGRRHHQETFYSFTSFTAPETIYRFDLESGKSEVLRAPKVGFDASKFETRQAFVESRDGTRVPLFITHRKGIALDGNHPALLYGYGGFNVSLTPFFSVQSAVWMDMGGVYAVANLRGGGEYGEEWHRAGTRLEKQKVFDDFIAAAEWLVKSRYTSPRRLAIQGASNGGLLVGACMTQRPELFGAALPQVGVMDMLRFHEFTIGWAWVDEYGSSEDAEEFGALRRYSPLHRIRPGTAYPATLITTGDHDDRVVPSHSFKFAAALQAAQRGAAPVLIRIQTRAGHGAGKPTRMEISEATDELAFLVEVLGM